MRSNSTLVRVGDGKQFRVVMLAHWSDIKAVDGSETDTVKLYGFENGAELFIGHSGKSYKVTLKDGS